MADELIFALDIGTRSVIGIVVEKNRQGLEITASEYLEHQNRAMIDGQIHDVEQVAQVIRIVKEKLEAKIGRPLEQVAVAAAGRALQTVKLRTLADIDKNKEIEREDILRLELQAVQEAQFRLSEGEQTEEEKSLNYHCVGYSVVNYELDGHKIGSLFGQKGTTMGVEAITTFLPRVVVDSLFAVLKRAGLEMVSLTLEPIAASAVVVPPGMRQLNIALVDVGAGTSDVAVTQNGSIAGYGMVPMAGDEITEKISEQYLVDFNQAEKIKRVLLQLDEITFSDVLGIEQTVSKQAVLDIIAETVVLLAERIGEKIVQINGRAPQAVIFIGGGSQTPMLTELLAERIGLPGQRVGIRGREAISGVSGAQELCGPEAVTPIGIAVTALERKGLGFAKVAVNNQQVRLFEVSRGTVADALLAAGISMRKTYPRLGMALTATVNGQLKIVKGGRGTPAVIRLNERSVTIDTPVTHDDIIEFAEATNGEDAQGSISDVIADVTPINISINSEPFTVNPLLTMNGKKVVSRDQLVDNAVIEYRIPETVGEALKAAGFSGPDRYKVFLNNQIADLSDEIADEDEIILEEGFRMAAPRKRKKTVRSANNGSATEVEVNGNIIAIPREDAILTDVLTRIDFPLRPPQAGMRLELIVNDAPAQFATPLRNGDIVKVEWK